MKIRGKKGMEQMNQLKKDYVTPQERLTRVNSTRKEKRKKMSENFKQKQIVGFMKRKKSIRNGFLKRLICRIKSLK